MKEVKKDKLSTWVLASDYKLCDSSITIKRVSVLEKGESRERTKIFLNAVFEIEKNQEPSDPEAIADCWLDPEIPIKVVIGGVEYAIGNKEEFLARRLFLQSVYQRLQRSAKYNKGGKRKRRMQLTNKVGNQEQSYIEYKVHQYSRFLIRLCLRHRIATIRLNNRDENKYAIGENDMLLRNWSEAQFVQKISYKANLAGITVIEN